MIYIASDHGGFELKKKIINHLLEGKKEVEDMGPQHLDPEDDYPDFVIPLTKQMENDPESLGIVICRNGVGVSMCVNKFKHIRAALSWDPKHAASAKSDDNTNVLALPADYIGETTALEIVDTWLETRFSFAPKHIRRLKKVETAHDTSDNS
jgi:RpiB/LacA/LacB family sugar-phosphate isomerase